jgi:hypothetical protein
MLDDSDISTAVGAERIHQNKTMEGYDGLYVWFSRSGTGDEDGLNDAEGEAPFREFLDVEVIGRVLDDVLDVVDEIRSHNKARGSFGEGTVQALLVRDHNDDYVPRGVFDDEEGLHIAALQIEVVGYESA